MEHFGRDCVLHNLFFFKCVLRVEVLVQHSGRDCVLPSTFFQQTHTHTCISRSSRLQQTATHTHACLTHTPPETQICNRLQHAHTYTHKYTHAHTHAHAHAHTHAHAHAHAISFFPTHRPTNIIRNVRFPDMPPYFCTP